MPTRKVNFDFYTFNCPTDQNALVNALENEIKLRKEGKVNNIKLFGFVCRIWEIEKTSEGFYVCNVEKINVLDEANIGDLQAERMTVATKPDQGPLFDTAFLYNPMNEVVVLQRNSRLGLGYKAFVSYLSKLTKKDDCDLEIIIDPKVIVKLDKMDMVKKIEYSVSNPTNLDFAKEQNRGMNGDLELAKKLLGSSLNVVIGSQRGSHLSLDEAKKKVKSLLGFSDNMSNIIVRGQIDDDMESINLIKHKVTYEEKFKLKKEEKLTVVKVVEALPKAYKFHEVNLNRMYINKS
ncbi:hypothetical protein AR443_04020 [Bacillus velezensis]|uniref:DUF6731 family protein n=1 Tax=Bacillus amyloliquefaciens group TaxID=1938374 RepID=UPI0006A8288F|nr:MULTISPECIES: DUF6731 family protein [Bacillus amyloliquefaciens group]KSW07161.1 hypothetical protein AR443_04020 [Bacillus velezensis]MCR4365413.1 hypothetical protein [Bacillus amyloliquefaciens]MCV3202284.1 hypothetical protein [Bacillus velezensis]MDW0355801.1 hypothetical protein [Bacillus velezensis]MEE1861717.1 hypothetical protein [Bacillus velezensis]